MRRNRFTCFLICFALSVLALVSSCQKDSEVAEPITAKTSLSADTVMPTPGNFLAVSGTLKIKYDDSIYTFDAAHDSVAFINVRVDDKTHYFGITAINKEHNMSFGISASGSAYNDLNSSIAGGQFLINTDAQKSAIQLSLSKYSGQKDFGNINIIQYNLDSELAKGTFFTFLAKDDKANSPYYRVEGTFDLQLK